MRNLRQLHLYLGCLFAPLIIYFALSGAWQAFRFNDLPKGEAPTLGRTLLHELSKPHTNSTLPGQDPKSSKSAAFNWIVVLTGLGIVTTTVLGCVLALKFGRSKRWVLACFGAGIIVPIFLLLFAGK